MLKININECRITFTIETEGPILIKSGEHVFDNQQIERLIRQEYRIRNNEKLPHMIFVRTFRNNRYEPYIPGSSLKGVIRNHAERIIKTLNSQGCCNIFQDRGVTK